MAKVYILWRWRITITKRRKPNLLKAFTEIVPYLTALGVVIGLGAALHAEKLRRKTHNKIADIKYKVR